MSTHDATPTTTAAAATRAIQGTEGRGEVRPESLLSAHATSLDWRDVPDAARTRTTALLADYIASVLAGLRSAQCRRIAAAAIVQSGSTVETNEACAAPIRWVPA